MATGKPGFIQVMSAHSEAAKRRKETKGKKENNGHFESALKAGANIPQKNQMASLNFSSNKSFA